MQILKISQKFCLLLTLIPTLSTADVIFDAKAISMLLKEDLPRLLNAEIEKQQAQLGSGYFADAFSPMLVSRIEATRSKEKSFSTASPVISENLTSMIGYQQKLPFGTGVSATITEGHPEYNFGTSKLGLRTTEAKLAAEIDLWKNIFGRLDRAQEQALNSQQELATLKSDLTVKSVEVSLRKILYKFYTIEQAINIGRAMVKGAEDQLKETDSRFKNSVADRGDVARSRSNVASRKAQLIQFEYQRESLLKVLREIVPSYQNQKIILGNVPFELEKNRLMSCVESIKTAEATPHNATLYDEMVSLIEKIKDSELTQANVYSDVDLKLQGSYFARGNGDSFSKSREEAFEKNRHGQSIALAVSIPFGSSSNDIEQTQISLANLKAKAQGQQTLMELESRHFYLKNSIDYLLAVMKNQSTNRENLLLRLDDVKTKYRQGRISLSEMILDQDAYLSSELALLDVQTTITEAILDYFLVFHKYDCPFNNLNA